MIEALLVLGAVLALAALGLLGPLVPTAWWLAGGVACTAFGLALGVPTGFWYHVRLRACLRARGELPPRWWLRPVALHGRLRAAERPEVLRWFFAGGVGFVLTLAGCGLVVLGVVLEAVRP